MITFFTICSVTVSLWPMVNRTGDRNTVFPSTQLIRTSDYAMTTVHESAKDAHVTQKRDEISDAQHTSVKSYEKMIASVKDLKEQTENSVDNVAAQGDGERTGDGTGRTPISGLHDVEDMPERYNSGEKGPSAKEALEICELLRAHYTPAGEKRHPKTERDRTVLDSLIATILSQATSNKNSSRAFRTLTTTFRRWEDAIKAGPRCIEEAIKCGGLAHTKAQRIHHILTCLKEEQGACTLEHLRKMSDEEAKYILCSFPGVGPKTAACVLMFNMKRAEFPVDTHVCRITRRLGWVEKSQSAEQVYSVLNEVIPSDIKYDLHVLLIKHGRRLCRAQNTKCGECPLVAKCIYALRGEGGWEDQR